MSENIPESIPTSADPRSRRPLKKSRPNPSSSNPLANDISDLFSDPTKQVSIPLTSTEIAAEHAAHAASQVPEIVTNVQGSSAGAGSGEFHVYKASRRREYERIKKMEDEVEKEEADKEWEEKKREREKLDEEKRRKNREKRDKKNKSKNKGKNNEGKERGDSNNNDGKNGIKAGPRIIGSAESKAEENSHALDRPDETGKDVIANPDEIGVVIHDDD